MVILKSATLGLDECRRVIVNNEPIDIDAKTLKKVYESYYFLKEFVKDKLIYGVNTGFGPMAQYKISHDDQIQLQYNLIRSHCSGSGNPIPQNNIKALMLARLNTLLLGCSGLHPDNIILLKDLINKNIYPVIFEHGGLGASGDLVQLAHLALTMIGEGDVYYKGKITKAADAFKAEKLKPMTIHIREGLGLMNGTSAMCGVGIVNLLHAKNLAKWSVEISAMIAEIVESYDDHYSDELNSVKRHKGQNEVAALMRDHLKDSKLVKNREKFLYNKPVTEDIIQDKVQEYYSIRCVPQIIGPIMDTIHFSEQVIMDEINSANDNPIIDYKDKNVFHGGNFHGDYPALEMDKLKIAITKLSMLLERQLNFLLNNKLNGKLPPFVNLGKIGLNLGMQGAQFTATSTVAENQTLSSSMYIHSISSNNDNQDIVSMGTNAALIAQKVIMNTYEVMAIHMCTIIQAIDYQGKTKQLSKRSRNIFNEMRELFPKFEKDSVIYPRILKVRKRLEVIED